MPKLDPGPKGNKGCCIPSLVRPKLEYAAPLWNPHHQTEIDKIEKVQRMLLTGPVDAGVTRVTLEKC